jgi:hypothetical protein
MISNDFPGSSAFETLGRTLVCFQLRHYG